MPTELPHAYVIIGDSPDAIVFPALVLADTWNGWARPVFTDATMESLSEWSIRVYSAEGDGPIISRGRDGGWFEVTPAEWSADARGPIDPASWAVCPVSQVRGGWMVDGWTWTVLACDACGEVHASGCE